MKIIFFSGWGFSKEYLQPFISQLSEVKEVINVDHFFEPLIDSNLEDAKLRKESIQKRLSDIHASIEKDDEKLHLIGWSLGGFLAIEYANLFPEQIASLTLIGTSCQFTRSTLKESANTDRNPERIKSIDDLYTGVQSYLNSGDTKVLTGFYYSLLNETPLLTTDSNENQQTKVPKLSDLISNAQLLNTKSLLAALTYLKAINLDEECKTLRTRTLIVHGALDALIPLQHGECLSNNIQGSKLICLNDGGHLLPLTHATLLGKQIQSFISEK